LPSGVPGACPICAVGAVGVVGAVGAVGAVAGFGGRFSVFSQSLVARFGSIDRHHHALLTMTSGCAVQPDGLCIVDHDGEDLHRSIPWRGHGTGVDDGHLGVRTRLHGFTGFLEGGLCDSMALRGESQQSHLRVESPGLTHLGIELKLDPLSRLDGDFFWKVLEGTIHVADPDNRKFVHAVRAALRARIRAGLGGVRLSL
jgi:hypothetical protein